MNNSNKKDVIVLPSNQEMLMSKLTIGKHDFDKIKNELKSVINEMPKDTTLPTVEATGGLFGLFSHKVTGEELNVLTDKIQGLMINQNNHIIRIFENLKMVYKTFETLDCKYIEAITVSIKDALAANRKAEISIDGLEKSQNDINKLISQQGQIIKVLSKFKSDLEKVKHIADVDNIFEDVLGIQNEANEISNILEKLSSEIKQVNDRISSAIDEQNVFVEKLNYFAEEKNKQEENIKELYEQDNKIISSIEIIHKEIETNISSLEKKLYSNETKIKQVDDFNKLEISKLNNTIANNKAEILDEIASTNKQTEKVLNAKIGDLSDKYQNQSSDLKELYSEVLSNKKDNETKNEMLISLNKSKDEQIKNLETEIKQLNAFSNKLFKRLKLFAVISCSCGLILFIFIVLLIGGII